MIIFEIRPMEPATYRRQTRRIAISLMLIFAALAMLLSGLAVMLFGEPGGDNFRWNLGGVIAGLIVTVALVRFVLWSQLWMAPAVYGWGLKRSLMRVTNQMHQVKQAVEAGDPQAMQVLRFYHLGLMQMYRLDANSEGLNALVPEINAHQERMEQAGLDLQQDGLDDVWLKAIARNAR